jgi:electron transfer flavoprotein-quinone oxidoreductase
MGDGVAPDFDVAVVGAGIAGSVVATLLARDGHSVVLVERGETPGSKNLSGGVLYGRVLDPVFPGWAAEAPVERLVTRNVITFLTATGAVSVDAQDPTLASPPNAVTVLRARFDPWLAQRAEKAGAFVMCGVKVDGLLTESDHGGSTRVVGVKAGDDELRTRVVVAADGVNSFLAQQVGLRRPPATSQRALGIKATVRLDADTIDERFGLASGFGSAHSLVGACTDGVGGGGFLYTNTDSLSVGLVLRLDDLVGQGKDAVTLFERYLEHPAVAPLLDGGEIAEYGAHLVNEGGLGMVGAIHAGGLVVVGDAAGLTLNTGLTIRGMDLAAGSAISAAAAVHRALDTGDTGAEALAAYRQHLMDSFVGRDLRTYAKAPAFLERPRMYADYGPLLQDVLHRVYDLDATPRSHLVKTAIQAFKASPVRLRDLVGDGIAGVSAL